ncbi:WD40/YVTN/BNR-like repeat-containing protein [Litorilituus sediminis]|uniref:Oxidoreductase n=1 Tax=Litorilituus sediminis TaxID=718192 RepID=A0A4P6P7G8_9GAMM|nr:YCF48-related protein [Litorilituus sediminis]QBG35385.1 oxidoreductase [Litorilituus sediminis]
MTPSLSTLVSSALVCLTLFVCQTACATDKTQANLQWHYYQLPAKVAFRGSAIKQNTFWLTGQNNHVFTSQDAGKTWQDKSVASNISTDFRDIQVFDKDTAIVMGAGSGEQSVLYKTQDGGTSWQLLYQNQHPQGFFNSIAFWDDTTGLLMADPIDGYFVIKKTIDGGKTWRRIAQHKLPTIKANEVGFAASGNTIIVGTNGQAWFTTGGLSASLYFSNDFGETWQRQAIPLYQESKTAGGYALALNSRQQVFVIGGDYLQRSAHYTNMVKLHQGEIQSIAGSNNGLRTAMSCQQNTCISLGKTGIDISNDHGNSWQKIASDAKQFNSPWGFFTLTSDNHQFLAAGANGKVAVIELARSNKSTPQ